MKTAPEYRKELIQLLEPAMRRHSSHRAFADAVECSAIAISNAVDFVHREEREKRYMDVVKGYSKEELQGFANAFGCLSLALTAEIHDALGEVFNSLELSNHYAGQFFTPYHLCKMMAMMTLQDPQELTRERGYFRAMEPCVGAGAMVIALADVLKGHDINYQQALHVTAVDVDVRCVHMAYVQLSLLHVPAVVVHGNSLTLEEWSRWRTPAHVIGGWEWKLHRDRAKVEPKAAAVAAPAVPAVAKNGNATQLKLF